MSVDPPNSLRGVRTPRLAAAILLAGSAALIAFAQPDSGGLLPPPTTPEPNTQPSPTSPPPKAETPAPNPPQSNPTPAPSAPAPATPATTPAPPATPAITPPAPPAEVEVELYFKDGRRLQGVLVSSDEDKVTMLVAGIATPFPRADIARVRTLESVEERYAKLRIAIDDRDFDGRLRLAEWLRERERYRLALSEIDGILALAPGFIEAADMRRLVEEEARLAELRQKPERSVPAPTPAPRAPTPRVEFPTLSERDINVIRVMEIDLERSPRVLIPRDTITALLDTYMGREGVPTTREGRDAFYRKPATEILATMFALRARELYPQVAVQDMPGSIRLFRESVHRNWLINSCATAACHGGDDAGRLYLDNRHGNSDKAVYTNFYILDRFNVSSGAKLIDYADPARSPLLQAGLPRDISFFKHPEVRAGPSRAIWKPVFQNTNDPKFRAAVDWISAMFQPRPEYPIDYIPPLPPNMQPPNENLAPVPADGARPAAPKPAGAPPKPR